MDFILNELSFFPFAENGNVAENRFRNLLSTFKEANSKYNITHIRFPVSFSYQKITENQSFFEWVSTLTNHTLKTLIVSLFKRPYLDDLTDEELSTYFQSEYSIEDVDCPTEDCPVGLPVAYIKSVPSISVDSHIYWRKRKINILKKNNTFSDPETFLVYNICNSEDINSVEFKEWLDNFFVKGLDEKSLLLYLGFSRYKVAFTKDFIEQLWQWKNDDFDQFKYILMLMKDVESFPFSGGMGQTENLKSRGKEASKRINIIDRLSYCLENDIVIFLACKGHYQFH